MVENNQLLCKHKCIHFAIPVNFSLKTTNFHVSNVFTPEVKLPR